MLPALIQLAATFLSLPPRSWSSDACSGWCTSPTKWSKNLRATTCSFEIGGGICQFLGELLDLVDDAGVGRTVRGHGTRRHCGMIEAGLVEVRSGELDVYEVPLPGPLPCTADVRVSEFVRPGRRARDVVRREGIHVGCEQRIDPRGLRVAFSQTSLPGHSRVMRMGCMRGSSTPGHPNPTIGH